MDKNLQTLNAIVHDDASMLQNLIRNGGGYPSISLGQFTLAEMASFFGSDACLQVLNIKQDLRFLVLKKGESKLSVLNLDAFENFFKITYRSSIHLPSYSFFQKLIKNCPYSLRNRYLAAENYALTEKYRKELLSHQMANISIRWISDEKGYGAFAESKIKKGEFVGEYTGRVRRIVRFALFKKNYPKLLASSPNVYCMHYPTKFWSFDYTAIDALYEGNLTRFINHDKQPNLKPLCLIDRGLLRLVFVANQDIEMHQELSFDYGPDFSLI